MKTVILNIEANGLDPKELWCCTTIDCETGEEHAFRRPDLNQDEFLDYMRYVARVVGHNACSYDMPVLSRLTRIDEMGVEFNVVDTLVVSRLLDFSRDGGHSLAAWSQVLAVEKTIQPPWDAFSEALVEHSLQNCRITLALYKRFLPYLQSKRWKSSINLEHFMVQACREINANGFHFNVDKARELRYNINKELEELDGEIRSAFQPKVSLVREIAPRLTKFGTLNRGDFRWLQSGDLSYFNGGPFSLIEYAEFNPGSPSQIVERLNEAGWKPTEKTKGHKKFLREKKSRGWKTSPEAEAKAIKYAEYGYTVSEVNLNTLPDTAPEAAKTLAKRIKYASRVRVLDEWIVNVCTDVPIKIESVKQLGRVTSELMIQNGLNVEELVKNGTLKEYAWNVWNSINPQKPLPTNNKNIKGDITYELPMDLLSKTLIEWFESKKVSVGYVTESEDLLSITIMPPGKSGNSCASDAMLLLDGLKANGLECLPIQKRIRGTINPLGAWTARCSHDKPNTGNIPRDDALFGREMRSLWDVDEGYLVGVDAESIQLRVLAHYINDQRFNDSLTSGRKEDGTDPHSLNKVALGNPCKSRNDAKTFVYAWLLGAGVGKVREILGCSHEEAKKSVNDFIGFYPGLRVLKSSVIPRDAARGYFEGFDGRYINIFGDDQSSREHFALAGYLQAGEVIVMKTAKTIWIPRLKREGVPFKLVNFVHDEDQTQVPPCDSFIEKEVTMETKNLKSLIGCSYDYEIIKSDDRLTTILQRVPENALYVAEVQAESIKLAGECLGLRCPMAGSILSGHGPIAIGQNWYETH